MIVFLVALLVIAWLLINYTDSNVPWWDAFTTALSIIGMWMLARKYLEQWWVWIMVSECDIIMPVVRHRQEPMYWDICL